MKRLNEHKVMYALLIAVAAMIGITINESCSEDEDYDNYSSSDELFTLADGVIGRGVENIPFFSKVSPTQQIDSVIITINQYEFGEFPQFFKYDTINISFKIVSDNTYSEFGFRNLSVSEPLIDVSNKYIKLKQNQNGILHFQIHLELKRNTLDSSPYTLKGEYNNNDYQIDQSLFTNL